MFESLHVVHVWNELYAYICGATGAEIDENDPSLVGDTTAADDDKSEECSEVEPIPVEDDDEIEGTNVDESVEGDWPVLEDEDGRRDDDTDEPPDELSVLLITELVLDPSAELLLTPVLESEAEEELGVVDSLLLAAAVLERAGEEDVVDSLLLSAAVLESARGEDVMASLLLLLSAAVPPVDDDDELDDTIVDESVDDDELVALTPVDDDDDGWPLDMTELDITGPTEVREELGWIGRSELESPVAGSSQAIEDEESDGDSNPLDVQPEREESEPG
jgi:hypothetical protein